MAEAQIEVGKDFNRALTAAVLAVVMLTLYGIFFPSSGLRRLIAVLVVGALLLAWPKTGRLVRATTTVSVVLGLVLVVVADATLTDIAYGFAQMSAIFVFFVLVRMLELPILSGNFHTTVARFLAQDLGIRSRARAGTMFAYGLTTGLSVGSVPISYRTIEEFWEEKDASSREFTARITAPAFTAANLATPVSPIVALTVESTGVSLPLVLALTVPLSIFLAASSARSVRAAGETPGVEGTRDPAVRRGAIEFFFAIAILVSALLVLDEALGVGPMAAASLSIAATVVVWQFRLVGRRAAQSLGGALRAQYTGWPEHFTLFCSGGFLVGGAIALTRSLGAATELSPALMALVLAAVPVVFVVAAVAGLYPFVMLAALGTILMPVYSSTGFTVVALSISLITGASAGFLMSPFSGQTLLVSAMARVTSFKVGLVWNRPFGVLLIVSGSVIALAAFALGGTP